MNMKRKALRCAVPLVLALALGTGLAAAGDPAPVAAKAPRLALPAAPVCEAPSQAPQPAVADAATQAPIAIDLFAPQPQPKAICPLIGCVNDQYCRRDRDCTAAPGGVCKLFCPTQGCCSYPAS
jgi:hypothetical protein